MKKKFIQVAVFFLVVFSFLICIISCKKSNEMSLDEISIATTDGTAALLAKTISKPWQGEEYVPGAVGGVWNSSMIEDPKTFNLIISERDATTSSIMAHMHDYLVDYDYVKKEFVPNCASPEIIVNEEEQTMSVVYTLRDDLYWSFYDSTEKIPVTSDDVIFWYDEIEGDPEFRSSAYNSQFTQLPDGTEKRYFVKQ